jgi:hypothetical protein
MKTESHKTEFHCKPVAAFVAAKQLTAGHSHCPLFSGRASIFIRFERDLERARPLKGEVQLLRTEGGQP